MERIIRYQGAIIRDGHILLVKQRGDGGYEWWNVPGGGRETGETEEQCILREMREETNLDVKIERLLIDGPRHRHSPYRQFKTYLCSVLEGTAQSNGVESIAVKWFDLEDESQWTLEVVNNETTYVMLQKISDAMANNPQ